MQFLVLHGLRGGESAGLTLRELLRRHGVKRSGPAFYQMMARLEDAGLVEGRYERRVEAGRAIKERWYRITASGVAAWLATRSFYASTGSTLPDGEPGRA